MSVKYKSRRVLELEDKYGSSIEQIIWADVSIALIAVQCGVTVSTIYEWRSQFPKEDSGE